MDKSESPRRLPKAYSRDKQLIEEGKFFNPVVDPGEGAPIRSLVRNGEVVWSEEEETQTIPRVREVWGSKEALDLALKAHRRATIGMVYASLSITLVVMVVCICLYLLGLPLGWWLGVSSQCPSVF
jgi:hypothetical protein